MRPAAPAAVGRGNHASNDTESAPPRRHGGSATAPNVLADAPLTLAEKPLALPDVKDPEPRQGTPPAPTPIERETLTAVLMRETLDEREHFAALVEGFQFNNPRQMKRLRNTYRLLKVLDHQRSNMQRLKRKMTMLFWQEYLHAAPETAAKAWEDELRAAIKPLSVAAPPESTPEPDTPPLPFTAESAFASPAAAKAAPIPLAPEFLKFLLETFALDGAEGVQAYDTLAGKVVGYVLPRGLL
jgi:hypothetical protein